MTASTAGPVTVTTITFVSIAGSVVFTRLYTRIFLLKNVGLDDWVMFAALVCFIVHFYHPQLAKVVSVGDENVAHQLSKLKSGTLALYLFHLRHPQYKSLLTLQQ
jgi:hypothetical protein